ncbi:hypothetical protein ADL01_13095 [Streptomyces sp. NRRL WC-3618]|nr:hypothetical protein ADL01_13095 [Streptomyces sp. NRRL WC-3618]
MVTGEDLHADPERGEVAQRPGGRRREVVPQRDETPEGQAVYVGRGPVPHSSRRANRATARVTRPYVLRHRRRLAGQGRLVHGQPGRAQQPYVRRDQVAGPEPDHVARNEVGDRDLPGVRRPATLRAPQDGRGTGGQLTQPVEETFRPMLAGGAQHTAHHDQGQDHRGRSPGRDGGRDEPEAQQYGG